MDTNVDKPWYFSRGLLQGLVLLAGVFVYCAYELLTRGTRIEVIFLIFIVFLIIAGVGIVFRRLTGLDTAAHHDEQRLSDGSVEREIIVNRSFPDVFDRCIESLQQFRNYTIISLDQENGMISAWVQVGFLEQWGNLTINLTRQTAGKTTVRIQSSASYPNLRVRDNMQEKIMGMVRSFVEQQSQTSFESPAAPEFSEFESSAKKQNWILKSPVSASWYSLVIPGLGQNYNGHYLKAGAFLFITIVSVFTIGIFAGIIWLAGVAEAYIEAQRINIGEISFRPSNDMAFAIHMIVGFFIVAMMIALLVYFSWGGSPEKFMSMIWK
ncbi:MAG: hypothetical protein WC379_14100 [Methanoregula sp.]|jgi:TM2 domain-containing membrane protein YozV